MFDAFLRWLASWKKVITHCPYCGGKERELPSGAWTCDTVGCPNFRNDKGETIR